MPNAYLQAVSAFIKTELRKVVADVVAEFLHGVKDGASAAFSAAPVKINLGGDKPNDKPETAPKAL